MILLCTIESSSGSVNSGNYTLDEIRQEIKLEDIILKYNFIISPVKSDEIINYNSSYFENNGIIYSIVPDTLDFTKKENYKIIFSWISRYKESFSFEPNLKDLDCDYGRYIARCYVSKSYFEGQKNGYYYVYHKNYLSKKTPNYEIYPLKVILTDNSKSSSEKVNTYGFIFALLIGFILF